MWLWEFTSIRNLERTILGWGLFGSFQDVVHGILQGVDEKVGLVVVAEVSRNL